MKISSNNDILWRTAQLNPLLNYKLVRHMESDFKDLFTAHPDWRPEWKHKEGDIPIPLTEVSPNNRLLIDTVLNTYYIYYDQYDREYQDRRTPVTDLMIASLELTLTPLCGRNIALIAPGDFREDIHAFFTSRITTIRGLDPEVICIVPHIDPTYAGLIATPLPFDPNAIFNIWSGIHLLNYSGMQYYSQSKTWIDKPSGYVQSVTKSENPNNTELGIIFWGCFALSKNDVNDTPKSAINLCTKN